MPAPGEIWLHRSYYLDRETGEEKRKYLLVLAVDRDDVVYRLLTSRQHGRPITPACYHGDPYPGFYLGIIGGQLSRQGWLDLREHDDDLQTRHFSNGPISLVTSLPRAVLCEALLCAANAQDTTRRQSKAIYAARQQLGC